MVVVQQELEDAEFIPMPEDSEPSSPDQLSSFSESVTLPYEELKELKAAAAAAAVSSEKGLSVMTSSSVTADQIRLGRYTSYCVVLSD